MTHRNHLSWPIEFEVDTPASQKAFNVDELIQLATLSLAKVRTKYLVSSCHAIEDCRWNALPNILIKINLKFLVSVRSSESIPKGTFTHTVHNISSIQLS